MEKLIKARFLLLLFLLPLKVFGATSADFIIAESEFLRGDYKSSKSFYLEIFKEDKTEYVLKRIIESSLLSSDKDGLLEILLDEESQKLIHDIQYDYRLSLLLMAGEFDVAASQIKMALTESLSPEVVSTIVKTIYSSLGYESGLKFVKKYKLKHLLE